MRIAVLNRFIFDLIKQLGREGEVVAVSSDCSVEEGSTARVVTDDGVVKSQDIVLSEYLSSESIDLEALREADPDLVFVVPHEDVDLKDGTPGGVVPLVEVELRLRALLGNPGVSLVGVRPCSLEQIYQAMQSIGDKLKSTGAAREKVSKLKAQVMDWGDNFYERTKNKRVTFLSSVTPLRLAGRWVPDLIGLCSAISQMPKGHLEDRDIEWADVVKFRPDVIVVAPAGADVMESGRTFKSLEKLAGWDKVPAVMRGEVVFCDGKTSFFNPFVGLIDSMAILISAIAGLEPGYIAPRDSFNRLRWLELHRHRL